MTAMSARNWVAASLALALGIATAFADDPGLGRDDDGTNWPSYGRTYSETHESPLAQINSRNVQRLGLSAAVDLGDDPHGATVPIAVNGIVYVTVGQSKVR